MEYHYEQSYSGSSSSHSNHHHHLRPEGSTSFTSHSQRSLISVPSLNTSQSQHHHPPPTTYHHCLTTLKNHTYTSSLTLSSNFLFTGSSDREIQSLNLNPEQNLNPNNKVVAGKGAVKSLVIDQSETHSTLYSAHQDHKIRVWKINNNNDNNKKTYTHVATLPTLGDRASNFLIPKNHVQIRRHKTRTWVHHVDTVSSLALSKDGTLLYSVSWDRTIKIWKTRDFTCLESVTNAHDDAINAVAVSYDGTVYTGSADKKIKIWRKNNQGEKKHFLVDTLEKHNSGINALVLSSDESVLYSGACDRSILVWETEYDDVDVDGGGKMVIVGALRGHTNSILCLAVVSDLVCSGSADKTIRIWRGVDREYSCLAVLKGHTGSIKCLSAVVEHCNSSEESEEATFLVYSGSLDCDIKVWQIFVPVI